MKKIKLVLVTCIIMALPAGGVYSQPKMVVVNMTNKTIPTIPNLKRGDFVKIRLEDFDWSGRYKITVGKKDSIVSIPEAPELFKTFLVGADFSKIIEGLSSFTPRTVPLMEKTTTQESVKMHGGMLVKYDVKAEAMAAFDTNLDAIIKYTHSSKTAADQLALKNIVFKSASSWIATATDLYTYRDLYGNDAFVNNLLEQLKKEADREAVLSASLATQMRSTRNALIAAHNQFNNTVLQPALQYSYQLDKGTLTAASAEANGITILNAKNLQASSIEGVFQSYLDATIDHTVLIRSNPELERADSLIHNYHKGFFQFVQQFDSAFNYKTISTAVDKAGRSRIFETLPFQVSGDITSLDIDISPFDQSKNLPAYSTHLVMPLRSSSYWAFSTGFNVNGLFDKNYNILTEKKNATDTVYSITEENATHYSIGVNAIFHKGWYLGKSSTSFHVAFGPGIGLEKKIRPRIFAGAGIAFGNENKLFITGGIVFGAVERLSTAYSSKTNYSIPPSELTTQKIMQAAFVSVGYSIFNK